jgi:hypothetical protein
MKGNIMDKKILLGGAAALLMAGSFVAAPASASIELSIGGEAKLTALMDDHCNVDQADDTINILADWVDTTYGGNDNDTATTAALIDAIMDDVNTDVTAEDDASDLDAITYIDSGCGSDAEDNPVLGFAKELSIGAEGTLANGLTVSFSDTLDLTDTSGEEGSFELSLGGAFGTLTFKDGADSAVDAAMVGDTSGADVTGFDLGGHVLATAGTDGTGILYQAPSVGALDLYISYAPNADDSGLDDSNYQDTFAFGVTYAADMLTVAAGFESASAEAACSAGGTLDGDTSAADAYDLIFKGETDCGDLSLMAVGMEMNAGDIALSAAWSELDTDEADLTTMSIGASTDVGDYSVAAGWANSTKAYGLESIEDEQTVINVELSTALGDGVDLGLNFSTNDVSVVSEENGAGHAGEMDNYFAELSLTVGF